MSRFCLLLALALLMLAGFWLTRPSTPQLHVLVGQSNAMGIMGEGRFYPPDADGLDAEIPFYYISHGTGSSEGRWTHLSPQTGRTSEGYFGPEITFARSLKKSGGKHAIFKYTLPSTSLAKDWKRPGQSGHYDFMLQSLGEAISLFEKEHGKVEISSFTWIQGESDAETDEMAVQYEENLCAVVAHFRAWSGNPKLPVIIGMDEQHPWVQERPIVVEAQQTIAHKTPNCAFLSMKGLEKKDASHLTPAGLVDHGLRWYDLYSELASRSF